MGTVNHFDSTGTAQARLTPDGVRHENRAVFFSHNYCFITLRLQSMAEIDYELAHFFAWARARAYQEFDEKMKSDPSLDPNWAFSDIMQRLLEEYRLWRRQSSEPAKSPDQPK
jgi:hypothetical protein